MLKLNHSLAKCGQLLEVICTFKFCEVIYIYRERSAKNMSFTGNPVDRHRKSMSVNQNSWHYRVYLWWMNQGGRVRQGYAENLCHYMRVVLIWAPIFWFFKARLYRAVRLWMIALSVIITLSSMVVYLIAPDKFFFTIFMVIFFTTIGMIAISSFLLISYMENNKHKRWVRTVISFFDKLFYLLAVLFLAPCWPIFKFNEWTNLRYGRNIVGWFWFQGRFKVIYPWSVAAAGTIVFSFFLVGVERTLSWILILTAVVAFVFGISFLIVLTIFFFDRIKDWNHSRILRKRYQTQSSLPASKIEHGTPAIILAGQFVMAQKNRICPFINLPNNPSLTRSAPYSKEVEN